MLPHVFIKNELLREATLLTPQHWLSDLSDVSIPWTGCESAGAWACVSNPLLGATDAAGRSHTVWTLLWSSGLHQFWNLDLGQFWLLQRKRHVNFTCNFFPFTNKSPHKMKNCFTDPFWFYDVLGNQPWITLAISWLSLCCHQDCRYLILSNLFKFWAFCLVFLSVGSAQREVQN